MGLITTAKSNAPNKGTAPPTRRLNKNDKTLLDTSNWVENGNESELLLEDKVELSSSKAAFLQGVVVYVGEVHFGDGVWVGVQLTGPSIGRGDCDGTYKGRRYFANVGKNNGAMAPLSMVHKRLATEANPEQGTNEKQQVARMESIDNLTEIRAAAILKENEEKKKKKLFYKEEIHVSRLRESSLDCHVRVTCDDNPTSSKSTSNKPSLKFAGPGAVLQACDLKFAEGLHKTRQNFCLSDPSLPDNPIVYASQAFLNMTGYHLNEILGRNCRFLQGAETDNYHVDRIRQSLREGADCHVCLLNYKKDGTPFYNRLFMTALRDTRGRIKSYLGVQCEVSEELAKKINSREKVRFETEKNNKKKVATAKKKNPTGEDNGSCAGTVQSSSSFKVETSNVTDALNRAMQDEDAWGFCPEEELLFLSLDSPLKPNKGKVSADTFQPVIVSSSAEMKVSEEQAKVPISTAESQGQWHFL